MKYVSGVPSSDGASSVRSTTTSPEMSKNDKDGLNTKTDNKQKLDTSEISSEDFWAGDTGKALKKLNEERDAKKNELATLKGELSDLTVNSPKYKEKQQEINNKTTQLKSLASRATILLYTETGLTDDDIEKSAKAVQKKFQEFLDKGSKYIDALQSAIMMTLTSSGGPLNVTIFNSQISNGVLRAEILSMGSDHDKQNEDQHINSADSTDKSTYIASGIAAQDKAQQVRNTAVTDPIINKDVIRNLLTYTIGETILTTAAEINTTEQHGNIQNNNIRVNN